MQSDIRIVYYEPFSIEPLENKDGLSILNQGLDLLNGKKAWISSGTLLGLYRDHQLIPHDTDIDVNVLDSVEIDLKGFTLIRKMWHQDRIMQTAFIKDGIIFDIYYFYSDILPGFGVNYNEHGVIEKPLEYIDDLDTLIHKGFSYPIPHDIERFLTWRFGDWKTPRTSKESWEIDATHLKHY